MRLFFFVPLLFLCCSMASLAMATAKNATTDQSVLLAFKAHVVDPRSVLANNWSISYPVCSWVGISCDVRHHRIKTLNLSDLSLHGTIPSHLGNLSFLVSLDISKNNFHGPLPNELRKLFRLRFIDFSFNELSGSLPSWIGALSNLQIISLGNNSFTGPIPNSLFNLSRLEKLYLQSNVIGGNIPSKLGNLSNLMQLNLFYNNLQGEIPNQLGNLQYLEYLNLGINNLTGLIPPTIFNITSMKSLGLETNQLSGHLPSTIGLSLPNIFFLALYENNLFGTIPHSITNASKLYMLDLSYNYFSGHIPNTFGNLRFLKTLIIANNYLTTESSTAEWSFLSSLTDCINLSYVVLDFNPLRGILPPLIGNFSASLQQFFASHCKLTGTIPQEIGNLSGLIRLSLGENDLNGTIPTSVGRLQHLQVLVLSNNNLQGSIPYDLCHMGGLFAVILDGNQLNGPIPKCLVGLTSLRFINLGSNKLTSSIPSSIWSLDDILSVNLSSNSLNGTLSSNVQNLKVLINLDLSKNQLSGDIPTTIGGLNNLVTLSLAGNQFKGHIPESLGNLKSLESMDLSDNNLSGEIPMSLEALSHMKQFNVSHNRLEGKIPTKGPFEIFSAQSFIWNHALCGPPLQVPSCKGDKNKGSKKSVIRVLKYVLPLIISTALVAIIIIFFIKRRNKSTKNLEQENLLSLATWRRTSYIDIQRATDGFNECNLLGTGSFGSVYKGILLDGTTVAIKVFNLNLERAFKSFDIECEVLRNVRHRNLVKILSSCCNIDFKALVLEFMPNDSLEKWLYSHNYFLSILERLNIMIYVGLALEYLHHGHSPPVVHCDLKPNNILLDENMVAHVSDFGISKLLGEGDDSVTQTMTMATIGYMAPEYGLEGIISSKCDVYSYGILLMETFTRMKPTDEMFIGEMNLKNWVKESLPHELIKVVDATLLQEEKTFYAKMDCLSSIMHLALDCCMDSPDQRICMTDAATKLKKIKVKYLKDVAKTN